MLTIRAIAVSLVLLISITAYGQKLEQDLINATVKGHTGDVLSLLAKGANPNAKREDGATALILAATMGSATIVEALLDKGANPNAKDSNSWSALMWAARENHIDVVYALLDKNAKPDMKSNNGWTALMLAAFNNHLESVQALLSKGIKRNAKNDEGETALTLAEKKGHTAIVQLLSDNSGKGSYQKPRESYIDRLNTRLMSAAEKGDIFDVRALLDKGANPNAKQEKGYTALMWAAMRNHLNVVQVLLARGADVSAKGNDGSTALIMAAFEGHTTIVQTLLAGGADMNTKTNNGSTALMVAAIRGRAATVQALLDKGADVNAKLDGGHTALMMAVWEGHTAAVQALLNKGADVNARTKDGMTALIMATRRGHAQIVRLLKGLKMDDPVEIPIELGPGAVAVNSKDGQEYVWVPPGKFWMGCVPGDDKCDDREKPRHLVTISNGFWMGRTEVTVEAYQRFTNATRRSMPEAPSFNPNWGKKEHPIVNVRWDDAKAYCQWSSGRLPTEAEWERAARGGKDGLKYPWGDDPSPERANYGTGLEGKVSGRDQWVHTAPVGSFPSNDYGLYDIVGNVLEWVADRYDRNYYAFSLPNDPPGPYSKNLSPLLRGGHWRSFLEELRISHRFPTGLFSEVVPQDFIGFRCVRENTP